LRFWVWKDYFVVYFTAQKYIDCWLPVVKLSIRLYIFNSFR
jgi:hypothetical protein